ncbi:MAG: anaerobic carbon-monoxide dehydrogenase catalytic subunit [Thermoplasmata archaeon]|nr:anaerobic carbon-monoxide dehydrogenase catalytic subunit [Thermoplasmata archaeon]
MPPPPENKTADKAVECVMNEACGDDVTTSWDRYQAMQPQCGFGDLGVCCRTCLMGPCQIAIYGDGPKEGVCGAKAYTIVARKIVRMICGGCSAHSDHGRHITHVLKDVAEGKAPAYSVKDPAKLKWVAEHVGITTEGKDELTLAGDVADAMFEEFSRQDGAPLRWLTGFLPEKRIKRVKQLGILGTNINTHVVEALHRTHVGVDADPVPLIFLGLKVALSDFAGMHISTDVSDILFGTPKYTRSYANMGALDAKMVNIAVHGHNPVLPEVMLDVMEDLVEEAKAVGAEGINLVGICCTGNEILMRRGIPIAGNFSSQELIVETGVLDALVFDMQCIMPSIATSTSHHHTELISTSDVARIVTDTHIEFHPETAEEDAKKIVRMAINAFTHRAEEKLIIVPEYKADVIAGFSTEQILEILAKVDPDNPIGVLNDAIKSGEIKGICLLAGCNNQKQPHDVTHLEFIREMAKRDVLMLATGCVAIAAAKAEYMSAESKDTFAGPGLKSFLERVGKAAGLELPVVWHQGSCVDNTRAADLATLMAEDLDVDIHRLPFCASAPEAMAEKAVSIGSWCVAIGWPTYVGVQPFIYGSPLITEIAERTARDVYGGFFIFDSDPIVGTNKLMEELEYRHWRLFGPGGLRP